MVWLERPDNKFGLAKPPFWFLEALEVFDPELRLFVSAKEPLYLLARRVTNTFAPDCAGILHDHPDTKFMAANRMILVRTFMPMIKWTTEIFDYLYNCDMWRHGGANKIADDFDNADKTRNVQQNKQYADDVNALSGAAYRAAKTRLGQRVFVGNNALSRSSILSPTGNG